MVRLFIFLFLILFVVWILGPFFKRKPRNKKISKLIEILNSDKGNFRQPVTILIVMSVLILFTLFLWLFQKFGINLLSLFQKIIPLISTLRGILPF